MEMYKLLVVDDEAIIVDGIFELFKELKSYPLDVYKAYSGAEALEWLNKKRIDIVITDIKMPGIDGLHLLEKIRRDWPGCKVIFLTGYDEFEYVYKAIQYDGVSYLLKTESYESIVEVVEDYLGQIQKSMKDEELIRKAQAQFHKVLPIMQKEFLTKLVDGVYLNVTQQQFDEVEIPMHVDMPVLMIVGCINENPKKASPGGKSDFYTVNFVVEQQMAKYASVAYVVYKNYLVWIVQEGKEVEEGHPAAEGHLSAYHFKGILETVQAICDETFSLKVSFAISRGAVEWSKLSDAFISLKAMLNYHGISGMETVLMEGNFQEETCKRFSINKTVTDVKLQLEKLEMLDLYLEQGRREEFFNTFNEIKGTLLYKADYFPVSYEIFYAFSLLYLSYMNRHSISETVSGEYFKMLTRFDLYQSLEEAFGCFENAAIHIFDQQNVEQEKRSIVSVQRVQQYIQDHPGKDLSLSSLADMVYLNPKYLSRLFKQTTGMYLSDYISEVKLSKAKELLKLNNMKIHEIAEFIGYSSAPYFTRFFKRATNMTPQEYRETFQQQVDKR